MLVMLRESPNYPKNYTDIATINTLRKYVAYSGLVLNNPIFTKTKYNKAF